MRGLRTLSKFLMLLPIITLGYDLIYGWFVQAHIRIRPFQEWWIWLDKPSYSSGKIIMLKILPPQTVDLLMKLPAPLTLLIPPVVIYIIYRILFAMKGGHGSNTFIYRSHD